MTDPLVAIARRNGLVGDAVMSALLEAFAAGSEARSAHRRPGGGRPRYGELPGESAILDRIAALREVGASSREIAEALNARGARRRGGKPWTVRTVRDVVRLSE